MFRSAILGPELWLTLRAAQLLRVNPDNVHVETDANVLSRR